MLQEIYINNFVLIDELRIQFNKGLNVLTGETGAGKSIIIDALSLILGGRLKNELIRDDSHKATAEAVFDISLNREARSYFESVDLLDHEEENLIVVRREIVPGGKNVTRINGRTVTASNLKTAAFYLVDMHLQHDHMSILRPNMYLSYVDSFINDVSGLLEHIKQVYSRLQARRRELQALRLDEKEKLQKLDFLNFQINEIQKAKLQPGEDQELLLLRDRISNAQKLLEGSSELTGLLHSHPREKSAYDLLAQAINVVNELSGDEFFASLANPLEDMHYHLEDIAASIAAYRDSLDFEPGLLDTVEERLHEIKRLKSKYGDTIENIQNFLDMALKEKESLENSQVRQENLEQEIAASESNYREMAARLHELRGQGAAILQERVKTELRELNMPHLKFEVRVIKQDIEGPSGMDGIEFLFSPNPGEELRPISRIASGGEISRFVLALKIALADIYQVATLIFDEIDIGVGGTSLVLMAGKLRQLANSHQIILVTHSPQVASYADNHYLISKYVAKGKTYTGVKQLDQKGRIEEIARMLAGDNYTEITLEHARELYENAAGIK